MTQKQYNIYVNGIAVEVTQEVYRAYWQEMEKEKYLIKVSREIISLDDVLENNEYTSVEIQFLKDTNPVHEEVMKREMIDLVLKEVKNLKPDEQELIKALYFEDYSQTYYAEKLNVTKQWISKKHQQILNKLRKTLKL